MRNVQTYLSGPRKRPTYFATPLPPPSEKGVYRSMQMYGNRQSRMNIIVSDFIFYLTSLLYLLCFLILRAEIYVVNSHLPY